LQRNTTTHFIHGHGTGRSNYRQYRTHTKDRSEHLNTSFDDTRCATNNTMPKSINIFLGGGGGGAMVT
jgi:hypothetical protein